MSAFIWFIASFGGVVIGLVLAYAIAYPRPYTDPIERQYGDER